MSVKLDKGHKVNLAKPDGGQLTKIFLGLGWDVAKDGTNIDLDANCVMLDGSKNATDKVWYAHKRSNDGSVQHSGDNLTGAGDGDDEVIEVDLSRVPASVQYLAFTVASYSRHKLSVLKNAYVRVLDDKGTELAKYNLTDLGDTTGMIMGKVYRHNGGWKFHAIGEPADGRTVDDQIAAVKTAC
jgi:tellurium resistance protein TerZ